MKMILSVENAEDLNRDFFKSDSAMVRIPEVGLELATGCMGSFYSTIEGFLEKVID
jgi:zinc finger protein